MRVFKNTTTGALSQGARDRSECQCWHLDDSGYPPGH